MTPLVIVNEDLGDIPLDNKARMMGSILAYGANAEIQVDQPSASTGSSIRSVWENFEEKDLAMLCLGLKFITCQVKHQLSQCIGMTIEQI